MRPPEISSRRRFAVVAALTVFSCALLSLFYFVFKTGTVVTHFLYLPAVLAALWWGRRGVSVAVLLAAAIVGCSHLAGLRPSPEEYLRAAMLVAIGTVVGVLADRFGAERERSRHLNLVLRAVRDINRLVRRIGERDHLLDQICSTLVEGRSYRFAWIALLGEDRRLVGAAEAGLGMRFSPMTEMLKYGTLPHCARRAEEQGQVVTVRDASLECAGCPLAALHMEEETVGRMTAFMRHGAARAILTVAASPHRIADEEERRLFADIAADIEYALGGLELRREHARALDALRESEERFRAIVENAPFGYYRLDADGCFVYVNREWERMLGFEADEVIGRHVEMIQRYRRDEDRKIVERVFRGETVRGEFSLQRKDGSVSHHAFTGQPVYRHGMPVGGEWFLNDITERIKAERALQRSERMMAQIIEGSPIPTFVIDENHRVTHWNRACEALTGYRSEEMIGTTNQWIPFYPSERPTMADIILDAARDPESVRRFEGEYRRADFPDDAGYAERFFPNLGDGGQWLFFTAAPLRDEEGRIIGAIETLQDVTVRKRAEEERAKAYAELEQLFNATPVGIRVIDRDCRTVHLNWRFMEMFGIDLNGLGGESLFVRDREIIRIDRRLMRRVLSGERYVEHEFRTRRSGGEAIFMVNATPYYSREGEIIGIIENFTNITEMRRLQDGIMRIAEQERRRIGQDLHDGLGQNLTAVTFLIEALKEKMAGSYPDGVPVIENIEGMVRDAIVQTRGLSRMLSPVEMDRHGLRSALDEMAAATEKVYGVSCRVREEGTFSVEDRTAATHLFYIAREAVTNAVKHGKAGLVQICLAEEDGDLVMSIRDDGSGAPDGPADTGLGLRIMRYRAGLIGADFSAGNRDGGGFEVTVRLRG